MQQTRLHQGIMYFLILVIFLLLIKPIEAQAPIETKPKAMGIFYGWPTSFGSSAQTAYTNKFSQFDLVVFGACIETSRHGAHSFTSDLIGILKTNNKEVYGYVDIGVSKFTKVEREKRIDAWKQMGVSGIFFDDFSMWYTGAGNGSWCGGFNGESSGYYTSWTSNDTKQNMIDAVNYTHSKGLKVFANSWGWNEDVNGTPLPKLLQDGDLVLAESLIAFDGTLYSSDKVTPNYKQYDNRISWKNNTNLWPNTGKIRIACISTMQTNSIPNPNSDLYKLSVAGAVAFGCDFDQISETNYGSGNANTLISYTIPQGINTIVLNTSQKITGTNGVYERQGPYATLNVKTIPNQSQYTITQKEGDVGAAGAGFTEADFTRWNCEYVGGGICNNPYSNKTADFNQNNTIDLLDFEIWRQGFY